MAPADQRGARLSLFPSIFYVMSGVLKINPDMVGGTNPCDICSHLLVSLSPAGKLFTAARISICYILNTILTSAFVWPYSDTAGAVCNSTKIIILSLQTVFITI